MYRNYDGCENVHFILSRNQNSLFQETQNQNYGSKLFVIWRNVNLFVLGFLNDKVAFILVQKFLTKEILINTHLCQGKFYFPDILKVTKEKLRTFIIIGLISIEYMSHFTLATLMTLTTLMTLMTLMSHGTHYLMALMSHFTLTTLITLLTLTTLMTLRRGGDGVGRRGKRG